MSDDTTGVETVEASKPSTVQEYRHAVRDIFSNNGVGKVLSILRGRPGLSQEEQVARLTESRELLKGVVADIEAAVAQADSLLAEAATFAAERDFEAHQAAKAEARAAAAESYSDEDEDEDVYEDEDDEEDDSDDAFN